MQGEIFTHLPCWSKAEFHQYSEKQGKIETKAGEGRYLLTNRRF
jgi:hypothetical protein